MITIMMVNRMEKGDELTTPNGRSVKLCPCWADDGRLVDGFLLSDGREDVTSGEAADFLNAA